MPISTLDIITLAVAAVIVVLIIQIYNAIMTVVHTHQYKVLEMEALSILRLPSLEVIPRFDVREVVKSRQTLDKYDDIRYFKENREQVNRAEAAIKRKEEMSAYLKQFLATNGLKDRPQYARLRENIEQVIGNAGAFRIKVTYISSAGNDLGSRSIAVTQSRIDTFKQNPSLLMSKAEYNKMLKDRQKEALSLKQSDFYEKVNAVIDYANTYRDTLFMKNSKANVDALISQLFDRTVNSIKKIKSLESEEWGMIQDIINFTGNEISKIVYANQKIMAYYSSPDFLRIKQTCEALMGSQREFNEYINEKVQSISTLFGTRVVRTETLNNDEFNYIRPYKKTITPFTAEVSAAVFASAENNPMEYVVKYFYPDKNKYPGQIEKLYLLVEELQTLKEAKQIIDNYKASYKQYLADVPTYIMEHDEEGFYTRLGFASINENVLTVEYKFVYTSNGGMAQRSFTIPMHEETIAELIKMLENKLSARAFAKEQRTMMTKKLREVIKTRDNFTCCHCGNSTHKEPNLLLEIDHIIPVSKGGRTEECNLQTLCWKCNRAKSDKIIDAVNAPGTI